MLKDPVLLVNRFGVFLGYLAEFVCFVAYEKQVCEDVKDY